MFPLDPLGKSGLTLSYKKRVGILSSKISVSSLSLVFGGDWHSFGRFL